MDLYDHAEKIERAALSVRAYICSGSNMRISYPFRQLPRAQPLQGTWAVRRQRKSTPTPSSKNWEGPNVDMQVLWILMEYLQASLYSSVNVL